MRRAALLPGAVSIVVAAVLRLLLAPLRVLSADEAYYLCAARRGGTPWPIDDHPPLLGAYLALADRWLPGPVELRVRLVAIALQIVTALGVARLAAGPSDAGETTNDEIARDARWTLGAVLATWGLLPMAGGLLATPDAPMLAALAWLLALLSERSSPRSEPTRRACLLALSALAVAAKASALPFVLVVAGAHLAQRQQGPERPARGRGVAIALGALSAAPLARASLVAQLAHVLGHGPRVTAPHVGAPAAVLAFVAGQLLLLGPAVCVVAIDVARRRGLRVLAIPRGVVAATALVFGAALASALVTGRPPEPNWTSPAAILLLAVTSVGIARTTRARRVVVLAVTIAPALLAVVLWGSRARVLPAGADPLARVPRAEVERAVIAASPALDDPAYARPAWRCVYLGDCAKIDEIFKVYP